MKRKKARGRSDAVAIHDGYAWRLLCGSDLCEASAPVASSADKLPQSLVDLAAREKCRRVLFLVSGDVHRMDGAIPPGMPLEKANDVIRASMAETTGVETDGLVVAGISATWGGVRRPFTLAAGFGGDMAEDFNAALADAGIVCAGFASLELAMLSAWKTANDGRERVQTTKGGRRRIPYAIGGRRGAAGGKDGGAGKRYGRDAVLIAVGAGHSFVVPAQRGANAGPQSVPCGQRHFASDPATWSVRFQRAASGIGKESPLHLVELGERIPADAGNADATGADGRNAVASGSVAGALREAGFADVVEEDAVEWMRLAAKAVLSARPNRLHGVSVPVANPYEPRRRFPNEWIVAAALVIFALPAIYRAAHERSTERVCSALVAEAEPYRPVERRIEKAKKVLAAAEAELAREQSTQRARIGARRPLMAFISVAQHFCKHSGDSLTLDAIEQSGSQISVCGSFSDPEDGVALNKGILEYAKRHDVEVVKNESVNETAEGDAAFANRFTIVLDCARFGEETAK